MFVYICSKVVSSLYNCHGWYTPYIQNQKDYVANRSEMEILVEKTQHLNAIQKMAIAQFYVLFRSLKMSMGVDEIKQKIDFFLYAQNSAMVDNDLRNEIIRIYLKCQRVYYAFLQTKKMYLLNKKEVHQGNDLYMNPIIRGHNQTFPLIQDGKLYLFTLFDLSQLIINALVASSNFFSVPSIIKNPYNNIPFSKTNLFNIYFQMKKNWAIIPQFIHWFFKTEFNIYEFKKKYENDILEYNVEKYVKNSSSTILYPETMRMVMNYDRCNSIKSPTSNKEITKLVNLLRPILRIHLLHKYTANRYRRDYYEFDLKRKMTKFIFAYVSLGDLFYETDDDEFRKMLKENSVNWDKTHMYDDRHFNYYIMNGRNETPYMNFQQLRLRPFASVGGMTGMGSLDTLNNGLLGNFGTGGFGNIGNNANMDTSIFTSIELPGIYQERDTSNNTIEEMINSIINNIFRVDNQENGQMDMSGGQPNTMGEMDMSGNEDMNIYSQYSVSNIPTQNNSSTRYVANIRYPTNLLTSIQTTMRENENTTPTPGITFPQRIQRLFPRTTFIVSSLGDESDYSSDDNQEQPQSEYTNPIEENDENHDDSDDNEDTEYSTTDYDDFEEEDYDW